MGKFVAFVFVYVAMGGTMNHIDSINGRYAFANGYDKIKLHLKKDDTYKLSWHSCLFACKETGNWNQKGDTVTLTPDIDKTQSSTKFNNNCDNAIKKYRYTNDTLIALIQIDGKTVEYLPIVKQP